MTPSIEKADARRFRADPAEGLKIVTLDGLLAIYQRRSGMTHIVDELGPLLIAPLGEKPLTVEQLIDVLEREYSLEAEGDLRDVVEARLAELEAVGLVWRA